MFITENRFMFGSILNHRRMSSTLACGVLVLSMLALSGCSDTPEMKMQKAAIAMENNQVQVALNLATEVHEVQPDNIEAVKVMAKAQVRLSQFGQADKSLALLMSAQPDEVEHRELSVVNMYRRIRRIADMSDLATNERASAELDAWVSKAHTEVQWIDDHFPDRGAEMAFQRALLSELRIIKLNKIRRERESQVENITIDGGNRRTDQAQAELDALDREVDIVFDEIEDQLRTALELDPAHHAARSMLARVYGQQEKWDALFTLAEQAAELEEVPVTLVTSLADRLLQGDELISSGDSYVTLARTLIDRVDDAGRQSEVWKISHARLLIKEQKPEEAGKVAEEVLARTPTNFEARFLLAHSLYLRGDYAAAKEVVARLATEAKTSPRVQMLYGLTLMMLGDYGLAREPLRRATELAPQSASVHEAYLMLLARMGETGNAEGDLQAFIAADPTNPRARLYSLRFDLAAGQQEAALKNLKEIEAFLPLQVAHLAILIDGYTALNMHAKVEYFARQLMDRQPNEPGGYLHLANAMMMQKRDKEARDLLVEVAKRFPGEGEVDQLLGTLYLQRQAYDKAIDVLEPMVVAYPDSIPTRLLLARGFAGLGMIHDANEQIQAILDRDPRNVEAHVTAARIYQFAGQPAKANEHITMINEEDLDEVQHPAFMAQIRLQAGDVDGAIEICNRAIVAGREEAAVRLLLANIYTDQNQLDQAENHLIRLVRTQAGNPRTWALLVRHFIRRGDINAGLQKLNQLQSADEVLARISQATLYSAGGQFREAMMRLEPVFPTLVANRDPRCMAFADVLARIYLANEQPDRAIDTYESMIQAGVLPNEARLKQADLVAVAKSTDDAVVRLNELAGTLGPDAVTIRNGVTTRLASMGRFDDALGWTAKWGKAQPDRSIYPIWTLQVLRAAGKNREAVAVAEVAIQKEPDYVPLLRELALAARLSGDYPKAEAALVKMSQADSGSQLVAYTELGLMYLSLGLDRQAAAAFDALARTGRPRDPRVLLSMGAALDRLGRKTEARERLEAIPDFVNQKILAEILIARIDFEAGRRDDSRDRVYRLAESPAFVRGLAQQLLGQGRGSDVYAQMFAWADERINLPQLSAEDKVKWMRLRVNRQAGDRDWAGALETLEAMSRQLPDDSTIAVARILVNGELKKPDAARRIFMQTSGLADTDLGAALEVVMYGRLRDAKMPKEPLLALLVAVAEGRPEEAGSYIEQLPSYQTIFRSDLRTMLARPDIAGPEMKINARRMVSGLMAIQLHLPDLAVVQGEYCVANAASLIPAYSLIATPLVDRNESVSALLRRVKSADPDSGLAKFLTARELQSKGEHVEAGELLLSLYDAEPTNPLLRYQASSNFHLGGEYDRAITLLEDIVKVPGPQQLPAANDLAYLMAVHQPDRIEEAYALARSAYEQAPNLPALVDTVAWIDFLRGHPDAALDALVRVLPSLSELPEVQYHAGMLYDATGNEAWARYFLEAAATAKDSKGIAGKAKDKLDELKAGA